MTLVTPHSISGWRRSWLSTPSREIGSEALTATGISPCCLGCPDERTPESALGAPAWGRCCPSWCSVDARTWFVRPPVSACAEGPTACHRTVTVTRRHCSTLVRAHGREAPTCPASKWFISAAVHPAPVQVTIPGIGPAAAQIIIAETHRHRRGKHQLTASSRPYRRCRRHPLGSGYLGGPSGHDRRAFSRRFGLGRCMATTCSRRARFTGRRPATPAFDAARELNRSSRRLVVPRVSTSTDRGTLPRGQISRLINTSAAHHLTAPRRGRRLRRRPAATGTSVERHVQPGLPARIRPPGPGARRRSPRQGRPTARSDQLLTGRSRSPHFTESPTRQVPTLTLTRRRSS